MGLDTTHGCWHGAYSAFHRWRTMIAMLGGYGEAWKDGKGTFLINNDESYHDILLGRWKEPPEDILLVLLMHQDCEGEIMPEHAGPLADRLEGLLANMPDEDAGGHIGYWHEKTKLFIAGLRVAAAQGRPVEFH